VGLPSISVSSLVMGERNHRPMGAARQIPRPAGESVGLRDDPVVEVASLVDSLLVAQGIHWVHAGRLQGGEKTGHDPHQGENREGDCHYGR